MALISSQSSERPVFVFRARPTRRVVQTQNGSVRVLSPSQLGAARAAAGQKGDPRSGALRGGAFSAAARNLTSVGEDEIVLVFMLKILRLAIYSKNFK